MKIDFIPLANVPTVESLTDSAKVLVIDSGEVKKTAKSNIGGGGGGSSDFSTAEVTIINTSETPINLDGIFIDESIDDLNPFMISHESSEETFEIVLYKGHSPLTFENGVIDSVTGSVEYEANVATITGNCTITVHYED